MDERYRKLAMTVLIRGLKTDNAAHVVLKAI
ncbi:MAG: hypothetical protein ACJAZO_001084 [Myxococcota bacterium]|jgi:hypothetical protein